MYLMIELYPFLALLAAWIQTPDGSNCAFALLCLLGLLGLPTRLCLSLTLLVHLTLLLM